MRILVTGHLGYIGSVLTRALLQAGHHVTGLDWHSSGEPKDGLTVLPGDIRDIAPGALQGFEAVIHLAALPADAEDERAPARSLEVNHLAAARLAVLAKVAGVQRFLFASASPEQRGGTQGYRTQEPAPRTPVPFDVAKGRAEIDLARLNSPEFRVVSLRIPSAYGQSPNMRRDLVLHAMLRDAMLHGELGIQRDADDLHHPIHVHDVVRGFLRALEAPPAELAHAVYDLGANIPAIKRSELARLVADRVEGARVKHVPSLHSTLTPAPRAPRTKPHALPGFATKVDLHVGISDLLADSKTEV